MIMLKLVMSDIRAQMVLEKLDRLRTELVELAFDLERGGRLDAADVAISTSARVRELCDEISDRA
jgi:hypothetical protein